MPDKNCLSIGVDINQWMGMTDKERQEQIFYCLHYLAQEAQKNKLMERIYTFAAHLFGSICVLIPIIIFLVDYLSRRHP